MKSLKFQLLLLFIGLLILSCNPTKYISSGETLLTDNHIIINKEGVKKTDLLPYIKQQPNKKIFGTRFHLGLYNLSNLDKEKWPHSWLRKIGEAPVVYDEYATIKSKEQIKSYVASKGYFDGKVMETVLSSKKKTEVFYNIDLKSPYSVRNIIYEVADSNLQNLCYFDSLNCVIAKGKPYDVDLLQKERLRFERLVKDHGFYAFSADDIFFRIDSTIGNRMVDVYYGVKEFTKIDQSGEVVEVPHSIYRVKDIYIYPDFVPKEALQGGDQYLKSLDTTEYKGYYFIAPPGKPEIKFDLIIQALYLHPGYTFNETNKEQSESHLLNLKSYRLVNIYYTDLNDKNSETGELQLNCNIQMTRLNKQSFKIELEGTNSTGNLGGALNLIYQNNNLFHGSELFSMKLKGAYEALTQKDTLLSTQEYGFETSLRLPVFLLPFIKTENFIKKYNPQTLILASYNYQSMPYYTRNTANATFGYNWKAGMYQEHIVNPLQLNVVKIPYINPIWESYIASSYLAYAYKDVMILGGNYSFIYNNQTINKSRHYWFMRINAESSGNMLSIASRLAGLKKTGEGFKTYNILGQPFAQYVRTDLDLRYTFIINDVSSIVYRTFFGIGIPYGNSRAIPIEKQYFGGGANGIRAWQVRSLGPGTFKPPAGAFLNQTGDIKLELNAEYRFKLFWILEGALFVDAGNIWTYNYDVAIEGSQFDIKNFYNQLAVGTGTGFRFDFKFVVGRVDIGMKLRDPSVVSGSKWIPGTRPYNFKNDFALVLGIGYPF